jgi:chromosome segregation ATPase
MYGRLIEDIETRLAAAVSKQRSSDEYLLDRARAAVLELRGELLSIAVEAKRNKDARDGLKGELEDLKEARADEAQTEHELRKTISELRAEIDRSINAKAQAELREQLKRLNEDLGGRININIELRRTNAALSEENERLKTDLAARAADTEVKCDKMNAMADEIASLERTLEDARQGFRAIGPTCRGLADMASRFINLPVARKSEP